MRSVMKQSVLGLLVGVALTSVVAQAGEVEVLHYWTSGGEAKSVAELKRLMESKGDTWKDFAVAGGGGENAATVLKTRVISGNPPTAAQMKAPMIQQWAKEGALANLDAAAKEGDFDKVLPPAVANGIKYQGHYVAVPVNVHRVNMLWANKQVFDKAGVKIPTNWSEFALAAEKLQKAGYIAVAHGGQAWQDATVFENIVLGLGGESFFNQVFVELDPKALSSPMMVKVFEAFGVYKKYTDKSAAGRDWNQATAMVIQGQAAMQIMGDWAKGEFTAAGKVPGKDYICAPAPGTSGAFIFNVDSFAMFKMKDPAATKAQNNLAVTIMSPQFQEIFNLNKGSIPVRSGTSLAKFDECALASNKDFQQASAKKSLVPAFAADMALPDGQKGPLQDVITQVFNSTTITPEAAAKLFAAAGAKAKKLN